MLISCPVLWTRAWDGCSEKVLVPLNKSFILLEGEGRDQTFIEWADHAGGDTDTASSPTFTSYPTDFMARDISFKGHAYHGGIWMHGEGVQHDRAGAMGKDAQLQETAKFVNVSYVSADGLAAQPS
ncbi:hypothetical protein ACQ4PT_016524 [Festuca glaucescens]